MIRVIPGNYIIVILIGFGMTYNVICSGSSLYSYYINYSLLGALFPWGNPVLLTAMGGETLN